MTSENTNAEQTRSNVFLELAQMAGQNIPAQRLVDFRRQNGFDGNPRYWAIVDFNQSSAQKRLYLFDTDTRKTERYYVAHGEGSEGKTGDGMAEVFSNVDGSHCSSLGIYLCGAEYVGKHGKSMQLKGLEACNSAAFDREIVMHGANYVSDAVIHAQGYAGDSWGCFAVDMSVKDKLVDELKNGSFIIAWKNEAHAPTATESSAITPTGLQLGDKKSLMERIISCFETGSPAGDYSNISIFHDGPKRMIGDELKRVRQITYGRWQTTEYGNLPRLVKDYVEAHGIFSHDLAPYVDKVGIVALTEDEHFKDLLRRAGRQDAEMKKTQDIFFDAVYFKPAMKWAAEHGLTMPLSALVIYDSFIHSGGIRKDIRSKFAEVPPSAGGDEKAWVTAYVNARNEWLANHSNPEVHPSIYRTKCFQREIAKGNWDLSQVPINANGTMVS